MKNCLSFFSLGKKLCLLSVGLACLPVFATSQVVEEIIAHVNNSIITNAEYARSKDQLRDEVKAQEAANVDKIYSEREKDVLRDLIDQQLLLDKGKDLGVTGDTELIKQLDQMRKEMKLDSVDDLEKEAAKQGISWEDFRQNMRNKIITQKVIGQEVGGRLSVTKDEEQKFYDEHKSEMERPESVQLSEILVMPKAPAGQGIDPKQAPNPNAQTDDPAALAAAEAKAKDLLRQIKDGASFEEVAKKNSDGPSAPDGGALGMFKRGQLAPQLEQQTFAMKTGEITDAIHVKQGYAILKVNEHVQAGIPPIKEVLPRVQDALYYEKLQPALRAYLTKLREDAYIKITDGYVDTGASPNQTAPVETAAAKEADAKKLGKKKKKKLGVL